MFEKHAPLVWRTKVTVYRIPDAPEPFWFVYHSEIPRGPAPRGPAGRKAELLRHGRAWSLWVPLSEAQRVVDAGTPGPGVMLTMKGRVDSSRGERDSSLYVEPLHHERFLKALAEILALTKRQEAHIPPGGSMDLWCRNEGEDWQHRIRPAPPQRPPT